MVQFFIVLSVVIPKRRHPCWTRLRDSRETDQTDLERQSGESLHVDSELRAQAVGIRLFNGLRKYNWSEPKSFIVIRGSLSVDVDMREERSAKISSFRRIRFTLCLEADRPVDPSEGMASYDTARSAPDER